MLILGLNASYHDCAAVLVRDGRVIAGTEEERLRRVKHTNAFPAHAIRLCLSEADVTLRDIDWIAVNISNETLRRRYMMAAQGQTVPDALSARDHWVRCFADQMDEHIDAGKLRFVDHQLAHAASAALCSGFTQCLALAVDGWGDGHSGAIFRVSAGVFEALRWFEDHESLGFLYGQVTKLLGFREFDEYKLMGLAPYGDPATYRELFEDCCELTSEGWYRIDRLSLITRLLRITTRRAPHDAVSDVHRDIAAACQETLERIVLHILRYYAQETQLRHLAMAGGVALNCSMNGKILASAMFDDVFIQPASSDAGGALGAALYVAGSERPSAAPLERLSSVYWGTRCPARPVLEKQLATWKRFLSWTHHPDVVQVAAEHLAAGRIIGWFQSRSEFGPRALGNRSILADPRPAVHRDVINRMIKMRESFRPFAPSVLAEKLADYFQVPSTQQQFPFMLFAVPVRVEQRSNLGATTHVDGTARIQTVKREDNAKYWELIKRFGDLTGTYVVLNTSFNSSAEPIVDSPEDAITAYLTTGLDYLILDDFVVTKHEITDDLLLDSAWAVSDSAQVFSIIGEAGPTAAATYRGEVKLAARAPVPISRRTFDVLCATDATTTLRAVLARIVGPDTDAIVLSDMRRLWWGRLIRLVTTD